MTDGSGLELLADLRRDDGGLIPVVVFSARDPDQLLLRQVEAVLTKSRTTLPQLADMVRKLLDERGSQSAAQEKIAV